MRFGRPEILALLLALPLLAPLAAWSLRRRRRRLERFAASAMLYRLAPGIPWEWPALRFALLGGGLAFLLLALAEPRWGGEEEKVRGRGADLVIAVDTSASMLAEDIRPSRLARAKAAITALLPLLRGDRVALVPFAGRAFVHCPLTSDLGATRIFLDILDPDLLPVPGTAIGTAIRTALTALPEAGAGHQAILMLTDGEDHGSDPMGAARAAAGRGVRIFTVGLGSPGGGVIPLRGRNGEISGYKKDAGGAVVTTRLDESTLAGIARISGGEYYGASASGDLELEAIATALRGIGTGDYEERTAVRLRDRFQWPLALAFLLLAAELCLPAVPPRRSAGSSLPGRRVVAAAIPIAFAWILATVTEAGPAARRVEEGNGRYRAGDLEGAMRDYTRAQVDSPDAPEIRYNLGNVLYRMGKWAEAAEEYHRARSSPAPRLAQAAAYNLGNARFQLGRFPEAVEAYEDALRRAPADADAKRNLELALARLAEQEAPPEGEAGPEASAAGSRETPGDAGASEPSGPEAPAPRNGEKAEAPSRPEGGTREDPPRRLSREEVARILAALEQEEKDSLRRGLRMAAGDSEGGKDW